MSHSSVPFFDPIRSLSTVLQQQLRAAFDRVLLSGCYILGDEVAQFEAEMATLCQSAYALGISSGTDALIIALQASGLKPGDRVLVPAYSFFATASTVVRCGLVPVWVDVCPGCYNMLPTEVLAASDSGAKGLMVAHLFGQMADLQPMLALSRRLQWVVIEDAAQALGSGLPQQGLGFAGSCGDVGCFSFFPTKNLGAFGDAGLLITPHASVFQKAKMLRNHGSQTAYVHEYLGGNYRLDALQAALLRCKHAQLGDMAAIRIRNATYYHQRFTALQIAEDSQCICQSNFQTHMQAGDPDWQKGAPLRLPINHRLEPLGHTYHQYVVQLQPRLRQKVIKALQQANIGFAHYYPQPLPMQPCFKTIQQVIRPIPYAEALCAQSLALPIFPGLTTTEMDYVVDTIAAAIS